jgi:hypothetical protein
MGTPTAVGTPEGTPVRTPVVTASPPVHPDSMSRTEFRSDQISGIQTLLVSSFFLPPTRGFFLWVSLALSPGFEDRLVFDFF